MDSNKDRGADFSNFPSTSKENVFKKEVMRYPDKYAANMPLGEKTSQFSSDYRQPEQPQAKTLNVLREAREKVNVDNPKPEDIAYYERTKNAVERAIEKILIQNTRKSD